MPTTLLLPRHGAVVISRATSEAPGPPDGRFRGRKPRKRSCFLEGARESAESRMGGVLRVGSESGTSNVRGYALALLLAMLLALGAAVPVFAAEEPTPEDEGTIQPQIVGGERVPGGKYPFVAALLDTTRPGSDYQEQFCGGTLIDEDSVLTAAHCLDEVLRPAKLQVVVGRTALDSDQGQKRGVTSVTPHPRYVSPEIRGGSRDFDAAVLQLDDPVTGIEP